MSSYRFVGSYQHIFDTPFELKRFGQLIEMPDDLARKSVSDGAQLIPPADFDAIGFTAEELKRGVDTPELAAKKRQAWAALQAFRQSLSAPEVLEPKQSDEAMTHDEHV